MTHFIPLFVVGLVLSSGIMFCTWLFAKRINNYSIVDVVWAFSFAVLTWCFAFASEGDLKRRILISVCVGLWSIRLGRFLTIRIHSHHPKEDGRYLELRNTYQPHVERGFFWFFQYQAWSVSLLTVPFVIISLNSQAQIETIEWMGAVFWLLSLTGESIADAQAKAFKTDPKNEGKVCDVGLWKYSRHPNYFFESLIWWAYYLMALASPGGVATIFCPLIMLFLLLKVTGVPLSEAQSLKSKGDAYREYQKRTSVFFPLPPKKI